MDPDELEAIRLTKNIFVNIDSISFLQSDDVDYLLVEGACDTYDKLFFH
jgi:hypothetical protein